MSFLWTRCSSPSHAFASFDEPYSYTPPAGLALSNYEVDRQLVRIAAPSDREADFDVWSVGPNWIPTCSAPARTTKFEPTAATFIDYLRSAPELTVSAATPTIGGSSATMVDITTAPGAKGCPGDGVVHLWKEAAMETRLASGDTERIIAMDQGDSTLVFEVYGEDLPGWWTDAQAILDTITFQAAARALPAP